MELDDQNLINTAPPPPSELKIRTMKSDLASMRASGGGAPKFQSVAVPGLSLDKEQSASAESRPSSVVAAPQSVYEPPKIPETYEVGSEEDIKSHFLPMTITIVVAIVAIIAVGYVAYITFGK
jgi:hypothetical protein